MQDEAGLNADVEQELFGELSDEDDAAAQQQEERGPPIDVHAPLLPRLVTQLHVFRHITTLLWANMNRRRSCCAADSTATQVQAWLFTIGTQRHSVKLFLSYQQCASWHNSNR